MPKIVTIPNPNKVRFRGDVTVDIDAFVAFAEHVRDATGRADGVAWAVRGNVRLRIVEGE